MPSARENARMLSIDEARARVLAAVRPLPPTPVPVADALDRVLRADVVAAGAVPPFANSAMDGFAVPPGAAGRRLPIVGESRAGHPATVALDGEQAIRISTGAMLPAGAEAVIMVERTREHPDGTVELDAEVAAGQNVRPAGDDVPAGEVLVRAGTLLGPAELGAAVGAGAASVVCGGRPRVEVISTGDELEEPGLPLGPGRLHDSNAVTVAALARRAGAHDVRRAHARDALGPTREAIGRALERADVVVLTGGVSVGPHDHVKPALDAAGVEEVFWRVALRPGKPTWFGTRDGALVFGLPGNPVSAMVTFLLFARPALLALQGAEPHARRIRAELTRAMPRTPGRDELVRVTLDGSRATPTGPQGSHRLSSMLGAGGLAIVPAGEGELAAGTEVVVELL
jgi:molybdopterin molybdotransferase